MKVGNIVNGLAVVDVKRVNKMNLIQFTKAVSEYIEQGYKLDVHSSRQVGLVLMVDMFKTEEPQPYADNNGVPPITEDGSIKITEDQSEWLSEKLAESPVVNESLKEALELHESLTKEPNETAIEALQESTGKLETVETIDEVIEEALSDLKDGGIDAVSSETEVEASEVEQTTPPVKKTRTKKTT